MRLRIPLAPRRAHGIDCPRPEIVIEVLNRSGEFSPIRFVVDTASDFSVISVPRAQENEIPFPESEETKVTIRGSAGSSAGHLGSITVRIFGRVRQWPCGFTGPPARAPERAAATAGARPRVPVSLLGRAGFLHDCEVCIDDTFLAVSWRGPIHRWWNSFRKRLRTWLRV